MTERDAVSIPNEEQVLEYSLIRKQLTDLNRELQTLINDPKHCLPFLQVHSLGSSPVWLTVCVCKAGRLVKVRDSKADWGWGCIVNFQKDSTKHKVLVSR